MNKRQRKKANKGGFIITDVNQQTGTITVTHYKSFQDAKRIESQLRRGKYNEPQT